MLVLVRRPRFALENSKIKALLYVDPRSVLYWLLFAPRIVVTYFVLSKRGKLIGDLT